MATYEIKPHGTNGSFGVARVWQVIEVDDSGPFPTRTVVSEHNSEGAAERKRDKLISQAPEPR